MGLMCATSDTAERGLASGLLVGLDAEEVVEDVALLGREVVLVACGVEDGLALVGRDGAEILKGLLDHCLAVRRQSGELVAGGVEAGAVLRGHVLDGLAPLEAALALGFRHLVEAMKLLGEPLLLLSGQAIKAGAVAKQAFLVLDGQIAMLVEPVTEMAGRGGETRRCIGLWSEIASGRGRLGHRTGGGRLLLRAIGGRVWVAICARIAAFGRCRLTLELRLVLPLELLALARLLAIVLLLLTAFLTLLLTLLLAHARAFADSLPCATAFKPGGRSGAALSGPLCRDDGRRKAQKQRCQHCCQAHCYRVGRPCHRSYHSRLLSRFG